MRKNYFLMLLFLGVLVTGLFAERESWLSIGYEQSFAFEHAADSETVVDSYMNSPGITLSSYTFWNGSNIGFFVHDSFLFPQTGKSTTNGNTIFVDFSVYDTANIIGLIMGPGYRYNISETTTLHFALGASMQQLSATYSQTIYPYGTVNFALLSYFLGLGGDAGIKFDITDSFYVEVGTVVNYHFKNFTFAASNLGSSSGWANSNYGMLTFQPYFCLGVNFYKTDESLGKRK